MVSAKEDRETEREKESQRQREKIRAREKRAYKEMIVWIVWWEGGDDPSLSLSPAGLSPSQPVIVFHENVTVVLILSPDALSLSTSATSVIFKETFASFLLLSSSLSLLDYISEEKITFLMNRELFLHVYGQNVFILLKNKIY